MELDRTKISLAEYFEISRQSLEREFTNIQNDGLIKIDKKTIYIENKNKLIQLIRF